MIATQLEPGRLWFALILNFGYPGAFCQLIGQFENFGLFPENSVKWDLNTSSFFFFPSFSFLVVLRFFL